MFRTNKVEFSVEKNARAIKVLSLTDVYPSLVQPWMINHLIQIERQGGQNGIVSYGSDDYEFDDELKKYQLAYNHVPLGSSNKEIVINFLKQSVDPLQLVSALRVFSAAEKKVTFKKNVHQLLTAYPFCVNADIVHTHSEGMGVRYLNLIKSRKFPLVHTFHGQTPIGVPTASVEQREKLTKHARAIFVNTKFAKAQYELLGAVSNNFEIIPQGIDLDKWPFCPKPAPSENETLHILTVGRIVEEKGHVYVIEAIKRLVDKGLKVIYHIVGRGPEQVKLEKQVRELKLINNVVFQGVLTGDALKNMYQKVHIFVLPSLRGNGQTWEETQGVVIQEAQASGLLVIGANSGGIAECIKDGENGFVVPDRDATAISHTVEQLLNKPELWVQWQRSGRDWVLANYSLDVIGKRMFTVYQDILSWYEK